MVGGRWNSSGRAAVYCGSSLALCVLETFAHLPLALRAVEALPAMTAVKVAPPSAELVIQVEDLGPFDLDDLAACRALGDAWLARGAALALSVPSALVPQERNIVLDPAHPMMSGMVVLSQEPFRFDRRLVQPEPSRT